MASHPLLKVKGRRDSLVFRLASGGPTVIVKESPDYLRVEAWLHSQSYPYSHIDTHTDSYYHMITLISHASKVILKIPQARLQQYVNCELPDVQAGFRKGRGPEIKLQTSVESLKKQESFRKASTSALLTMPKPLTVWITINCGKF